MTAKQQAEQLAHALRALVHATRPLYTPEGQLFPKEWHDARAALAAFNATKGKRYGERTIDNY